jgi:hypothetical protein
MLFLPKFAYIYVNTLQLFIDVGHNVVMSFSAVANIKKLLAHKKSPDGLDCIHGLKLISVFLIIMGHRLMFNLGSPLINTEFIEGVSAPHNN